MCLFDVLIGAGRRFNTVDLQVVPFSVGQRRGQPVGALATSSDGGDISANLLAKRPVLVLFAQRPSVSYRCRPAVAASVLFSEVSAL